MTEFSKAYFAYCPDCGKKREVCDCGGEGLAGQAKVEAENKKDKKK